MSSGKVVNGVPRSAYITSDSYGIWDRLSPPAGNWRQLKNKKLDRITGFSGLTGYFINSFKFLLINTIKCFYFSSNKYSE